MKTTFFTLLLSLSTLATSKSSIGDDFKQGNGAILNYVDWSIDSNGINGTAHDGDDFGSALSHGDFNNDGWDDLAIGVPGYGILASGVSRAGAVVVVYGSDIGLSSVNNQLLTQELEVNGDGIEANDSFGYSLAVGDFNGDGFDDLAVGTPYEDIINNNESQALAGAVNIFFGGSTGLTDNSIQLSKNLFSPGSGPRSNNYFGQQLAAGDFNADGFDDLAVAEPGYDIGMPAFQDNIGMVIVYSGSQLGISTTDVHYLVQTFGAAETGDKLGSSLATGHFNNDSYTDLAIGVPGNRVNGVVGAGSVFIVNGGSDGLTGLGETWSQAGAIIGLVEENDSFGKSLAAADINGDGLDDLLVGIPNEDLDSDGVFNAGAVNIIYATENGLSTSGNQLFHQNTAGILGEANNFVHFGSALKAGDINNDGYADVMIGVPNDTVNMFEYAGSFHLLLGGPAGAEVTDNLHILNDAAGDTTDHLFGAALSIGNFGNNQKLAIGIPRAYSVNNVKEAGKVRVFSVDTDIIFKDDFEN